MTFHNKNGLDWDQIIDNISNGTVPEKTYPSFVTDIITAIDNPIVATTRELYKKAHEADANFELDRGAELNKIARTLSNWGTDQDALAALALAYLTSGDTHRIERFRDAHDLIEHVVRYAKFDTTSFENDSAHRAYTLARHIRSSKYDPWDRIEKTIILLLWAIAIENK